MKILMKNINGREADTVCFFDGSKISYKDQKFKFVTDSGDPVSEAQARKRGFVLDSVFDHPKFKYKTEVSDYLRGTLKLHPGHPDYGKLYADLSDKLDTASSKVEHPGARQVQFGRQIPQPPEEDKGVIKIETDPSGEQRKYRVYRSGHRTLIGESLPRPYNRTNPVTGVYEKVTPRWNDNGEVIEVIS